MATRRTQPGTTLSSIVCNVEVVVGPVEVERDDLRGWPWPDAVSFVVEATPCALAARLQDAGRFYGNDSGVTHLAAALGDTPFAVVGEVTADANLRFTDGDAAIAVLRVADAEASWKRPLDLDGTLTAEAAR